MLYPTVIRGHPFASRLFQHVDKKMSTKACPMDVVGASACPMVASSDFQWSHGHPPLGDVHGIVPAHCYGLQSGQQTRVCFHCRLLRCRASSRPMAASRGIWCVPGHAASNGAICIPQLQHILMAIVMDCEGGTFTHHRHLFPQHYS
jgi:hypothetical protein